MAQTLSVAQQAHKNIVVERERLLAKARAEVEAEWAERIKRNDKEVAIARQIRQDHVAALRRVEAERSSQKLDRVLDGIVGKPKRGRGRPKGSKNKPKTEIVGSIPGDDLIVRRY